MTKKHSLDDYKDLMNTKINVDFSKLPQSFWDSVGKMLNRNAERFAKEEKARRMSYEDMHRPFDL